MTPNSQHTQQRISGVCPVVETPFTSEGEVDLASMERLLDHLYAVGVRQIMYPGYASEFYKLTDAERDALTQTVVQRFGSREDTVVVISVPDHATRVAVERARRAVELGADMINILPPFLHGPSAAEVQAHVRAVLTAIAPVPAIVQYAPAQTGVALAPGVIAEMAAASPNLVQVKVESAPPGQFISALSAAAPLLDSVVGHAGVQLIDARARGAVGVQPGCSFSELYLRIWSHWDAGEPERARALHARLLPFISYWMQGVELIIAAEKWISARRGIIASDHCRAPARQLDSEEIALLERFLAEFSEELSAVRS
ncbi:dihydrodipicolinate synthase family protein [Leucobacter sp. M11]|uniref:dihydrodipicolinate synthase family protein n=1 Tax=Leucobacter sp. M11 TaxID=2993565 RepID=UPI002D7F5701|nr:dihydrodipicolinate synthase family protein [Leucobacter sp. M11]MEB4614562.1 dihydrodipicolinate synthase family protein [Leucobacter sp. M11]